MSAAVASKRINLTGDWSISGVGRQLTTVREHLSELTRGSMPPGADAPLQEYPEIDLTGVESFDACGCQLLVTFVKYLHSLGYNPVLVAIPAEISGTIRTLGFGNDLEAFLDYGVTPA